jgi:hypothetical protein
MLCQKQIAPAMRGLNLRVQCLVNVLSFARQTLKPREGVEGGESRPEQTSATVRRSVLIVPNAAVVDVVPAGPRAGVLQLVTEQTRQIVEARDLVVQVAFGARGNGIKGLVQILVRETRRVGHLQEITAA